MKTFATLLLLILTATIAPAANLAVAGFEITAADDVDVCISKEGGLLYISAPGGDIIRDNAGRIIQAGSVSIEYLNDGTIGNIGNDMIKRDSADKITSVGEIVITRNIDGTIVGIGEAVIKRAENGTIISVVGDDRVRPVLIETQEIQEISESTK